MNDSLRISIRELGYLVYGSAKLELWKEFSEKVLGAMPVLNGSGGLDVRLDDRATRLVFQPDPIERLIAVGWLVANEKAYRQAHGYAKTRGIWTNDGSAQECAARRVCDFFVVRDPDGTSHEIAWGPQVDYLHSFRSSLGATRFVTDEQGLGHVVLGCMNGCFRQTVDFWVEHFGLVMANMRKNALGPDQNIFEIHWYGCSNGRHHTIATANIETNHRCHHVMLEYPQIDDVGRAYDRVEKHGFKYASTLGRHVNDRIISFYVESPSGFWFELGCDAGTDKGGDLLVIDDGGRGSVWGHKFLIPPAGRVVRSP